jgi:hypothetical protein
MKRSPLRPMSAERRASLPARRKCVEIVLARDKGCVLPSRWNPEGWPWITVVPPRPCWGPLDVHEPGHRSQGADPTDPSQAVCLCRGCHDWVHAHPLIAKALTL